MSFMLALPKISLHGADAIGDMFKLVAVNAIRALSKRVGISQGFSQPGVSKEDIEGWLDKALTDPCAPCNPRTASRDEVRELYLEAL